MQKELLFVILIISAHLITAGSFEQYGIDQNITVEQTSKSVNIIFNTVDTPAYIEPILTAVGHTELGVYVNNRFIDNVNVDHNGRYYIRIPDNIIQKDNKLELILRADKGKLTLSDKSEIKKENASTYQIKYGITPKDPAIGDTIVYKIHISNVSDHALNLLLRPKLRTDIFEVISGKEEYTLNLGRNETKDIIILLKAKKSTKITMPHPDIICTPKPCECKEEISPTFLISERKADLHPSIVAKRNYKDISVQIIIKNSSNIDANINSLNLYINDTTKQEIAKNLIIKAKSQFKSSIVIPRSPQENTQLTLDMLYQNKHTIIKSMVKPVDESRILNIYAAFIILFGIAIAAFVLFKTRNSS